MKRLLQTMFSFLLATPVMSADVSYEEAYKIVTQGNVLQSGVYSRQNYCDTPEINYRTNGSNTGAGAYAYCDNYINYRSIVVSLILYEEELYKCHVGALPKYDDEKKRYWVNGMVCLIVPKTNPNN